MNLLLFPSQMIYMKVLGMLTKWPYPSEIKSLLLPPFQGNPQTRTINPSYPRGNHQSPNFPNRGSAPGQSPNQCGLTICAASVANYFLKFWLIVIPTIKCILFSPFYPLKSNFTQCYKGEGNWHYTITTTKSRFEKQSVFLQALCSHIKHITKHW